MKLPAGTHHLDFSVGCLLTGNCRPGQASDCALSSVCSWVRTADHKKAVFGAISSARDVTAALAVIFTSRLKFLNTSLILTIVIKIKEAIIFILSTNYQIIVI